MSCFQKKQTVLLVLSGYMNAVDAVFRVNNNTAKHLLIHGDQTGVAGLSIPVVTHGYENTAWFFSMLLCAFKVNRLIYLCILILKILNNTRRQ